MIKYLPFCPGGRKIVLFVWTIGLAVMSASCCSRPQAGRCPLKEQARTAAAEQAQAPQEAPSVDAFMGDWQGGWRLDDGGDSGSLAAQVIALGKGQYQARLLEGFDARVKPYVVLQGQLEDGRASLSGHSVLPNDPLELDAQAVIETDKFTGSFKGRQEANGQEYRGTFSLSKTVRLSATLGAKPPAGAVVLFDGKNFDQWEQIGGFVGIINIAEAVGSGDNAAAYLRSHLLSSESRDAVLELGSDDGVKVWLNGQIVHANNASRAVTPGQDKVQVNLKEGMNELIFKVTNGGGDWGACARLAGANGKPLTGIAEIDPDSFDVTSAKATDRYLMKNGGFLTIWQVCGPYRQAAKSAQELFDVPVGPEKAGWDSVTWKWVNNNGADTRQAAWRLADSAMEVKPGTGSIVTKKKFKDFKLHIEFRTPFMPEARGQGRGNSGVYLQGRYEVQVLDSYALEGMDNECGGIYQVGAPLVNMCAPPMQWQTYDIIFTAPRFNSSGDKTQDATATIVHNGVTIHDRLKIPHPTGGALDNNVAEPGAIYLQDHGNLVQFRNIWLVEQN